MSWRNKYSWSSGWSISWNFLLSPFPGLTPSSWSLTVTTPVPFPPVVTGQSVRSTVGYDRLWVYQDSLEYRSRRRFRTPFVFPHWLWICFWGGWEVTRSTKFHSRDLRYRNVVTRGGGSRPCSYRSRGRDSSELSRRPLPRCKVHLSDCNKNHGRHYVL